MPSAARSRNLQHSADDIIRTPVLGAPAMHRNSLTARGRMARPLHFAILACVMAAPVFADGRQISFSKDIQPVFQKTCWNCHGATVQLSKLSLITRDAALKGGEHGTVIIPGSAEKSRLFRLVA